MNFTCIRIDAIPLEGVVQGTESLSWPGDDKSIFGYVYLLLAMQKWKEQKGDGHFGYYWKMHSLYQLVRTLSEAFLISRLEVSLLELDRFVNGQVGTDQFESAENGFSADRTKSQGK